MKTIVNKLKSLTYDQMFQCTRNSIIVGILVSIIACIAGNIMIHYEIIPKFNIAYYAVLCGGFLLTYLISAMYVKERPVKENQQDTSAITTFYSAMFTIAMFITSLLWAVDIVIGGGFDDIPWFESPTIGLACMLVLFAVFMFANRDIYSEKSWLDRDKRMNTACTVGYWAIVVVCAVLAAKSYWCPYGTRQYELYHQSAYTYELYARANSIPYTELTSSVYGHFGVLLLPFIKLLGGYTFLNVNIVISALGVILTLLFGASIWMVIKKPAIRCIAMLGVCLHSAGIYRVGGCYWQGAPHRVFLIALVVFVFALEYRYQIPKWVKIVLHGLISAFAMLWVSDFGLITILTFSIYDFLIYADKDKFTAKGAVKGILAAILNAVFAVGIALGAINLYNACVGGPVIFKELFFPLLNQFSDKLTHTIFVGAPTFIHPSFWMTIAMLGIGIYAFCKSDNKKNLAIVGVAVFTVGTFTYYISRALLYYMICYTFPLMIVLLAWYFENVSKKRVKAIVFDWLLIFTLFIAVLGVIRAPNFLTKPSNDEFFVKAAAYMEEVSEGKPCYIVGDLAHEVDVVLQWNTSDDSDYIHIYIPTNGEEELKKRILEHDKFFVISDDYYYKGLERMIARTAETTEMTWEDKYSEVLEQYELVDTYLDKGKIYIEYYVRKGTDNVQ